ncbi:Uncharacterised protein [Bacteroides xylanisolvens]|nr:Uncharacterised protein [Bacteroides xylanisolvens]
MLVSLALFILSALFPATLIFPSITADLLAVILTSVFLENLLLPKPAEPIFTSPFICKVSVMIFKEAVLLGSILVP